MPDPKRPLSEGKIAALRLLKQANDDAEDVGDDPRQFASSKEAFAAVGATESDLLWLVKCRFAEHLQDVTRDTEAQRQFRVLTGARLRDNSCFVLTHLGKVYVERNGFGPAAEAPTTSTARQQPGQPPAERICWDRQRHELWVDGILAKRFKHVALTQWDVLDKFQARGWEGVLQLDPAGDHQRQPGQRVREVVAELNKSLERSLIHFRKDCASIGITYDLSPS